jgi:hypothetical protein
MVVVVLLDIANRCGLLIPDTIISTQKKELQTFTNSSTKTISKGIWENFFYENEDVALRNYTVDVQYLGFFRPRPLVL